jgi:hypothetical protein
MREARTSKRQTGMATFMIWPDLNFEFRACFGMACTRSARLAIAIAGWKECGVLSRQIVGTGSPLKPQYRYSNFGFLR